jgi:gliding motility-associated-like protein
MWNAPLITVAQLVINEYSAANKDAFKTSEEQILKRGTYTNKDKFEDWVEIFNNSNSSISLSGYALSDHVGDLQKYLLPANITIPGKGRMVFVCSGKNGYFGNYHHTNFKLSQTSGKDVLVLSKNGVIVDSVKVLPCMKNHSRGRMSDGHPNWGVFDAATPNTANANPKQRYLKAPSFNRAAGFWNSAFYVELNSSETCGTIYYTTDGSNPLHSATAQPYTAPIHITQTTAVRACVRPAATSNTLPSPVVTNTYFIGENHVLPVISLCSSDFGNLFQFMKPNIEIEGSMEYFDKNKVRQFKVEGGIKGHGNDSWYYEQKGMRFYVRDEYGDASKIDYPLFSTSSRTHYDCLILRAGGSDNYVGFADASPSTHLRDGFAQTLAEKGNLHLDTRKYQAVIVYLNGHYWGIYELRERVDEKYTKAYYNEGKEGVDMLSYYGGISTENDASGRALSDWCSLYQFVRNNDMKNDANYQYVASQIEVMSLIDYFCLNTFMVNSDWLNWNTAWWRGKHATNGKWRYRLWDQDNIFNLGQNFSNIPATDAASANACDVQQVSSLLNAGCEQGHLDIFNALMNNPTFRNLYINRYADLLNTTFSKTHMLNHLNAMVADIQPEMQRHCQRWDAGNASSYQKWLNNIQYLRQQISARADKIYTSMDTCYQSAPLSGIVVNVMPAHSGSVAVNTIVPAQYPVSLTYFKNVAVNFSALPGIGYRFSHWIIKNQMVSNIHAAAIQVSFNIQDTVVAVFVEDKPNTVLYSDSIYRGNRYDNSNIRHLTPVAIDGGDDDNVLAHIEKDNEEYEHKAPGKTATHEIRVPSVFTPNGDGNSDILYVLGATLRNFRFAIFNIAGQMIFSTTQPSEGWDGNISGTPAPVGTYVYFVTGLLENDTRVFKNSTVTLLR